MATKEDPSARPAAAGDGPDPDDHDLGSKVDALIGGGDGGGPDRAADSGGQDERSAFEAVAEGQVAEEAFHEALEGADAAEEGADDADGADRDGGFGPDLDLDLDVDEAAFDEDEAAFDEDEEAAEDEAEVDAEDGPQAEEDDPAADVPREADAETESVDAPAEGDAGEAAEDEARAEDDEADDEAGAEPEEPEKTKKKGLLGRLLGGKDDPDEEVAPEELEIAWEDQTGQTLLDEYPIKEPYAYVRCMLDEETNRKIYHVGEPKLNDEDREIIDMLVEGLGKTLDVKVDELEEDPEEHLRVACEELIRGLRLDLSPVRKERIMYYVIRDFLGFGLIDVLMNDPNIEDISCDGADVPVFIYHRHHESMESTIQYENEEVLESFVIRLAQRAGKHISVADPLIDATLEDGSRAVISLGREVTTKGSTYTIRKFREEPFTPVSLIEFNTFSPQQMAYFWLAVEHGMSALVVGGTASGKTTTLNACCLFIPHQMKIVSIEDTREINLPNPNWIPGTTRSGFGGEVVGGKQVGEVDMFDLLKAALRQRPEYILVGEIRGQEAYAMFQAMSTGHTAYSTVHADSIQSLVHRLENKPIEIPRVMLPSLDLVTIQIQTRLKGERVRRCKEMVEVIGLDPNSKELLTNRVFRWDIATDHHEYGGKSYVLERIAAKTNMTQKELWNEVEQRKEILEWMLRKDIKNYQTVGEIIAKYYMKPEKVLDLVERDAEPEKAEKVLAGIPIEEGAEGGDGAGGGAADAIEAETEASEVDEIEAAVAEDAAAPEEEPSTGEPTEPAEAEAPSDEPVLGEMPPDPDAGGFEDADGADDALVPEAGTGPAGDASGGAGGGSDGEGGLGRSVDDLIAHAGKSRDEGADDILPGTPEDIFRDKLGLDAPDAEELMKQEMERRRKEQERIAAGGDADADPDEKGGADGDADDDGDEDADGDEDDDHVGDRVDEILGGSGDADAADPDADDDADEDDEG